MMVKGINCISAHVSDLQRSKRFYGETLGWALETDEQDVAGFSFGEGYLVIHTDTRNGEARRYAGGMYVLVQVEGIDAEHARLKGLGVAVSELRDQPWGQRTFTFTDPDGYMWSYGQST
jgi:catechol 2,3-dioxygenase-like lactoylglutathione lyase family enzyme